MAERDFRVADFSNRYMHLEGSIIDLIVTLKDCEGKEREEALEWLLFLLNDQVRRGHRVFPEYDNNLDFELSVMMKEYPLLQRYLDFAGATDADRAQALAERVERMLGEVEDVHEITC